MSRQQDGSAPDLSVILTAHDETLVAGPTMQAADAAIAAARAAGFVVEPIIVLDNAKPDCAAWFKQPALDHWHRIELQEGDLGRARNAALKHARGAFIAYHDADDLLSENWLAEGCKLLAAARDAGEKRIVHPELNWLFDGGRSVYHKPDQDDRLFTPWYFYAMNYYDSMCLAPREVHEEIPYATRDIPNGLSYQDWQFSVETMQAGWRHVSARDTIIFKRRRDNSLVTESRNRQAVVRALKGMAVDEIDALGAPHNRTPVADPPLPPALPPSPAPALKDRGILGRLTRRKARRDDPKVPPVPLIPERVPHSGAVLAERVAYARQYADRDPARGIRGYDRVAGAMDLAYYLSRAPDLVSARRIDPVGHFIRRGVEESRNPNPMFGTRFYLKRYPEAERDPAGPLHHYLTKGAAEGQITAPFERFDEMAALLDLTPQAAQALLGERQADLRNRLEFGTLGEMVNRAAAFEPLISATWPEALSLRIPPFHGDVVVNRVTAIHAMIKAVGETRARAVICVNRARWGGARRMEGHIAHALAQGIGADQIVVLSTDGSGKLPEGRLPDGVRHVAFAQMVAPLTGDEAQRVLVQLLRALRPEAVFNINSRLLWDALPTYGKAMRASFRIIAGLFCNERTILGYGTGYPLTRVYRNFDVLDAIVTDSHALAGDLRARHMLTGEAAAKISVLSGPVDTTIALAPPPAGNARPQIFWSGRFDAQKRVDLAYAIARLRPDWDLRMWGDAVMGGERALPAAPDNVKRMGTYARFGDLPLDQADVWLYTAAWDGVPQTLLEVGMAGVPLVGTDVGGTCEVLRDGLAEALPADAPPEAYVAAIETVLADKDAARARAATLRETLIAERPSDAYVPQVMALMTGNAP